MTSSSDFLTALFRPERRARARQRRLAVLSACALPHPVKVRALSEALGEDLEEGVELACEHGECRLLPGGELAPSGHAVLDMAVTLLEVPLVTAALGRVAPLVEEEDLRLLLVFASDPGGEGPRLLRAGAPGRVAGMAAGLLHALETPGAQPVPASWDAAPWGAEARRVSALLATAAHVLVRQGRRAAGRALVAWALGPEGMTGRVSPHHGFLAPTCVQFLLDAGRREEGAAFAHEAQGRLVAPEDTFSRIMLKVLEGRVAIDGGEEGPARRLFTQVELQARAAGLEDLVGIAKVAFATLARRADQNAAAIQLCHAALELVLGDEPFEALALHNLGLALAKDGRHLDAQAALTRSLVGMDIPFQQLTAWPQAIAIDCFLGDTAEAGRKLEAFAALCADTPQARLALGLCRAHLHSARGEWDEALRTLDGLCISDVTAQNQLYTVPAGWLRVEALLALERSEEAAKTLDGLARDLYLSNLSTQPSGLHLLDARVAFANGDKARARRALRRTQAHPEAVSTQDFELRARVLDYQLACAEPGEVQRERTRRAALEAWQSLTEPLPPEARARFRRAYDRPRLLALLGEALEEEAEAPPYLRGGSAAFRASVAQLRRVAGSDASILLLGETGVGKELAARAIHDFSTRASGPFVAVNCAAITDELLLSDLFGHERGAFTGAASRHQGRFEQAHGGTLFLDEVADISPRGQAALLRALQERTFERVGGSEAVRVDVRIIAASNRDLADAVRTDGFRQDLFFRLNGIQVVLPPLRERGDDVLLLARHFLEQTARERGGEPKRASPEAERLLRAHPWPGNVRELRNVVQAADVLSETAVLSATVLAPLLQRALACGVEPRPSVSAESAPDTYALFRQHGGTLRDFLSDLQRRCIERCLVEHGGNVAATAAELGISRSRLTQLVLGDAELRRVAGRAG